MGFDKLDAPAADEGCTVACRFCLLTPSKRRQASLSPRPEDARVIPVARRTTPDLSKS
jgi:hypothetical protein